MRFLTLLPLFALLASAAPNAAAPARNQKASTSPEPSDRSTGRIGQFRELWKERAQHNAPAGATTMPPKMGKLVNNAEERDRKKKAPPIPPTKKGTPSPLANKKAPPAAVPKQKSAADSRLPATLRGIGLERRQVDNLPQQCRGSSASPLEGNAKYANPATFFKFSEQELGTKYSPQQLSAAKEKLESSLRNASEREKVKSSNDPPPVQYDDEFLRFAGLTREQVAPPPKDLFHNEAKKAGLDKFDGVQKRNAGPRYNALVHPPYYRPQAWNYEPDYPSYYWSPNPQPAEPVHHPGSYYHPQPTAEYIHPVETEYVILEQPTPYLPGAACCSEPKEEARTDIDINSDETKTLVMLIEDIKRYIIFYNVNNVEDILLSTDSDVDITVADAGARPGFDFDYDAGVTSYPCHGDTAHGRLSLEELDGLARQLGKPRHGCDYELLELPRVRAKAVKESEVAESEAAGREAAKAMATEPPVALNEQRKKYDDQIKALEPWCPIADQEVLRVLEVMV